LPDAERRILAEYLLHDVEFVLFLVNLMLLRKSKHAASMSAIAWYISRAYNVRGDEVPE
jgi:hypothetical protein